MPELFIDGEWRDAIEGATREIRCPADGTLVATVPEAGPKDAELAVAAARRAFGTPYGSFRRGCAFDTAAMPFRSQVICRSYC